METTSHYTMGSIIAVRELDFNDDGLEKKIFIKIGKPIRYKRTKNEYYCPFTITGIGEESIKAAHGTDSMQALELALQMIGALLNNYYKRLYPGKITWNGGAWLGFSPPPDLSDG